MPHHSSRRLLWLSGCLIGLSAAAVVGVTAVGVAGLLVSPGQSREPYKRVEELLSQGTNIVGEKIVYPTGGPAKVTAVIVSMMPGEATGPHKHGVPLFAYMLEGELTVDYGTHGTKVYKPGDSFLEAMSVEHNGHNRGDTTARVLVVFMGAEGATNTIPLHPKPQ